MFADTLTVAEAKFTEGAISSLTSAHWPGALLRRLEQRGGICSYNMPLLFEARMAYALDRIGNAVSYEYVTGVGGRSVDFRVRGTGEWLIEVVRIGRSDAIKAATHKSNNLFALCLSTTADDRRQSEEGEVIKAMEKIAEKASKFPEPCTTRFHVIMVDIRGYLGHGGDSDDYREMAYGARAVRPEHSHSWNDEPTFGLFDRENTRNSPQLVQQRVHFIGFIRERQFYEGEIQNTGFYVWNPNLFAGQRAAAEAFTNFPLRPINAD